MTNKFQIPNSKFTKIIKTVFLASAIVFLAAGCNLNQSSVNNQEPIKKRTQIQVTQKVEGDIGNKLFNFYVDENRTALDLLKDGHKIETKSFSKIGEFVESINGKSPKSDEFWAFYVNGKQAQVGASDYKPVNGDNIEWKLEKIESY